MQLYHYYVFIKLYNVRISDNTSRDIFSRNKMSLIGFINVRCGFRYIFLKTFSFYFVKDFVVVILLVFVNYNNLGLCW